MCVCAYVLIQSLICEFRLLVATKHTVRRPTVCYFIS
jgi:hypothetical protein